MTLCADITFWNGHHLFGCSCTAVVQEAAKEVPAILSIVQCVLDVFMPDKVQIGGGNELHAWRLSQHCEETEVLNNSSLRPALIPAKFLHKTVMEVSEIAQRLLRIQPRFLSPWHVSDDRCTAVD